MGGRYVNPTPQYLDDNGDPLAGGILYFSENGAPWSTNPQNVYSDAALTTPMTFVTLDAGGRCPNIFASYEDTYRVVLKTSAGVTVFTKDNVTVYDVTALLAALADLEDLVDQVTAQTLSIGAISNPSCDAAGAPGIITLTTALQESAVGGWWTRVAGTVTAGTAQLGRLSGLGSVETQILADGVSGDSSSVVEFVNYMSAEDAIRYASKTCSLSVAVRQESGLTSPWTVAIYKADGFNNFTTTTLIQSNSTNVASSTNATINLDGVAMGDCSNGIKFVISCAPGAAFTTKDFYATDLNFVIAAAAGDYAPNPSALRRMAVFFKSLTGQYFYTERSTPPAGSVHVNGQTIGNSASGATARANEDTRDLYVLRWNTYDNTAAPVSGGRGASANADFDAGKTLGLFDLRGYFLRAVNTSGTGKDDTRTLGSQQDDAFQGHYHDAVQGGLSGAGGAAVNVLQSGGGFKGSDMVSGAVSDTVNGTPRIADETRPVNSAALLCVYL